MPHAITFIAMASHDRAVFASLLADRRLAACLCGAAAMHLGLRVAGLAGWRCPVLAACGVPCPGCGLSRAAVELLRGEFALALARHAFAPVLIAALGIVAASMVLQPTGRKRLVEWMRRIEVRTHLSAWLLAALLLYWALRMALDGARFVSLVT